MPDKFKYGAKPLTLLEVPPECTAPFLSLQRCTEILVSPVHFYNRSNILQLCNLYFLVMKNGRKRGTIRFITAVRHDIFCSQISCVKLQKQDPTAIRGTLFPKKKFDQDNVTSSLQLLCYSDSMCLTPLPLSFPINTDTIARLLHSEL